MLVREEEIKEVPREGCGCRQLLIVDDNEYNLFVLQNYLKSLRLVADEALNGLEAINKVMQKAKNPCCRGYKLVVMDLNMPLMGGVEATQVIKEKARNGEIPETTVVALSAETLNPEEEDACCNEAGFAAYASKPMTKEEFFGLLRRFALTS